MTIKRSPNYILIGKVSYKRGDMSLEEYQELESFISTHPHEEFTTDIEMFDLHKRENTLKQIKSAVQEELDGRAKAQGYDNIINATVRAGITGSRNQAEGMKFGMWMDDVWDYYHNELEKVDQGLRPEPTVEEFLAELPELTL